jgi:hypothetical protein
LRQLNLPVDFIGTSVPRRDRLCRRSSRQRCTPRTQCRHDCGVPTSRAVGVHPRHASRLGEGVSAGQVTRRATSTSPSPHHASAMRLRWFQLAHQVLPVPVGRNQMLGYPRKGHSSSYSESN